MFAADSDGGFDERVSRWEKTAALLNEMNAALGHRPAYPFSPSPRALEKCALPTNWCGRMRGRRGDFFC